MGLILLVVNWTAACIGGGGEYLSLFQTISLFVPTKFSLKLRNLKKYYFDGDQHAIILC